MDDTHLTRKSAGELEMAPVESGSRRSGGRRQRITAVLCIVLGLVLAPLAVAGSWVKTQLLDTERFVHTLAPLGGEPDVQAFLGDQVTAVLLDRIDLEARVSDAFDRLPYLDLLQGSTVQGLESLVGTVVHGTVNSERFEGLWEQILRLSHSQAIAIMGQNPSNAIESEANGTLSLRLDPLITESTNALEERGVPLTALIPQAEISVVIAPPEALASLQRAYPVVVASGTWLPPVALGLLVIGVGLLPRALTVTAAGLAGAMLLLAGTLAWAQSWLVANLGLDTLPVETVRLIYQQLTQELRSTTVALAVFAALLALLVWIADPRQPATGRRPLTRQATATLRVARARRGGKSGNFGRLVDRVHPVLLPLIALGGLLVVFLGSPPTLGSALGTVLVLAVIFLLVEVIRQPPTADLLGEPQSRGRQQ